MTSAPLLASRQQLLYEEAVASFGPALARLIRSYERDDDKRQDLRQEIHLALWRSFGRFDDRCSMRTWTYRVAHNVAASFVLRRRRSRDAHAVTLDEAEALADDRRPDEIVNRALMVDRMHALIAELRPPDQQIILLYLEDVDAAGIAEITGLSAANVATKISRIKKVIARMVRPEEPDAAG